MQYLFRCERLLHNASQEGRSANCQAGPSRQFLGCERLLHMFKAATGALQQLYVISACDISTANIRKKRAPDEAHFCFQNYDFVKILMPSLLLLASHLFNRLPDCLDSHKEKLQSKDMHAGTSAQITTQCGREQQTQSAGGQHLYQPALSASASSPAQNDKS